MTYSGRKMSSFSLSDSYITAEFQRICGIKIHYQNSKQESHTHSNGDSIKTSNGTSECNGSVYKTDQNNHRSMVSENGAVATKRNAHTHTSGLTSSNGLDLSDNKNGMKVNGVTNGFVKELKAQNGLKSRYKDHAESNGCTPSSDKVSCKPELSANGHSKEDNTEWSVSYTIENPILYYLFSFGASLGNEIFYILFFSSTLWNFDSYVVRKVLIVWCVIMYLGQAAKDFIRWPRPKSPPVVRLEQRYELEYGMPSTHAMVGVAIPFGMLVFMSGRYEFQFLYGLLFAIAWSILVSFSRLYLGMHSVLDIIAGIGFAIFLMGVTVPFVDKVDKFLISHPNSIPVMVTVCIILCFLYPSLDKWSTARGDTTLTLAVFSGIYAGLWLTGKFHPTDVDYFVTPAPETPPYVLAVPPVAECCLAMVRQVVGVIIVVIILTLLKLAILHAFARLMGLDPKDPCTKRHLVMELPYKYVSYFLSAAAATYLMPILFLRMGIARPSYYSEIFNHT